MSLITVTSEDPVLDFSDLIDALVLRQQDRIAQRPWFEAKFVRQLDQQLNSLFNRYETFKDRVLADKAAKFKMAGITFMAEEGAGITTLSAKYAGFTVTSPPGGQALVDGTWTIGGALSYSVTALREAQANDGTVTTQVRITLSGDTFAGTNGQTLGEVTNVPDGLTASLTRQNDTLAILTLSGKAEAHASVNSITNLTVEFSAEDFFSQSIAGKSNLIQDFSLTFYSLMLSERNNVLEITGSVSEVIRIDLQSNKTLVGGVENELQSGLMAAVTDIDLSDMIVAASGLSDAYVVTVIGDGQDNDLIAAAVTGSYRLGGGNDTLTLGSGVDTVVFESTGSANGVDEIENFKIGTGGDILKVTEFLNVPQLAKLANVVNLDTGSGASTWGNGDVLIMVGSGLSTPTAIEAAFTGQFTTNVRGKAVIITADVIGDASVWYLVNQDDINDIAVSEITKVATLENLANFGMSGFAFTSANFA